MRVAQRFLIPACLSAGALAAGAAARQDAGPEQTSPEERAAITRELSGMVAGSSSSCLPPGAARSASSRIYGSTIIYRVSAGLKYRSDTNVRCTRPGGNRDWDILVTSTPIGRSCAGDPVQVIDRNTGALTGVCAFGPFVSYRRP